jgi:hypothetical protein
MRFTTFATAALAAAVATAQDVVEDAKDAASDAASSVSYVVESATSISVPKATFTVSCQPGLTGMLKC